jgi:hypothetical protein
MLFAGAGAIGTGIVLLRLRRRREDVAFTADETPATE